MSLGLVVLEKLFTRTRTPTPQSDDIKIDKVAITHLAMEIHFQTTDHVVAVEKVAEQHIGTKYSKCNSLRLISHIIRLGKNAITHSKVGQSSPKPQKY